MVCFEGFSKANHTWLPVHENYIELNLAKQIIANESHYKIYTSLIKMRQRKAALQHGNLKTLVQNNGQVLIVIRQYNEQSVVLLMNFDDQIDQVVNLTGQGLANELVVEIATIGLPITKG